MVLDRILDTISVTITPKITTKITANVDQIDDHAPKAELAKKIDEIVIKKGKRPLHGTKLLVSIATNLSLGESIILQPTTPAALHPNPIHIVKACFPEVYAFLKKLSKLKAILGKYPKSSKIVKSGKKIAIGGSITATTHARVLYIPNINIFISQEGLLKYSNSKTNLSSI